MNFKDILKVTSLPVIVASLCCLYPVILVLFGLSTVAFASSLSDILYGQYKWIFRLIGLILLAIAIIIYLRKREKICTLDEAKKQRNKIINIIAISVSAAIIGYILWLYVIVEIIGIILGIWG